MSGIKSNQNLDISHVLTITAIEENEDGTLEVDVEFGKDFRQWFMEKEDLKRWSTKRFKKVMGKLLSDYVKKGREGRDE